MPSTRPAVARPTAPDRRARRRGLLLAAAIAGATLGGAAGVATAATTWLTRWSSVGAQVSFGDLPGDAEKRGWATLDPADLSASAEIDLGLDAFAGDHTGGTATATQQSTLTDAGLFARLGVDLFAGEGNDPTSGQEAVSVTTVLLRTTFALDAPAAFAFFPLGTPGDEATSAIAGYGGSVAGTATLDGEGLSWSADLTDGDGGLGELRDGLTGDLPAGTYTLRYALSAEALAATVMLDVPVGLTLTPADGMAPSAASPAVVPLPASGWAGLATAGLIALAAWCRRSVVLV